MKHEVYEATKNIIPIHGAFFEPFKDEFKNRLFKNNGIVQTLNDKIKAISSSTSDLPDDKVDELLRLSNKPEDWLEICFYSEQNSDLNHEKLWVEGLAKFNSSALYLENLGYFYYQKGKFHKALDYLSKSHALEKSFFALTLAIAASYAVTQYHLVLDYFEKLNAKDRLKLDDNLLFKVATSAQYEKKYDLALQIFKSVQKKNKIEQLPSLQEALLVKFGGVKKMKSWFEQMNEKINDAELRAKLTLDELITYASVLIHENKFDKALRHLESVKKERFT
jgi:tetratricopeptide (TPR) repeat protein